MCRATSKSRSLTARFRSGASVPQAKETMPSCGVKCFLHASISLCLADSDASFKEKKTLCANMAVLPVSASRLLVRGFTIQSANGGGHIRFHLERGYKRTARAEHLGRKKN